MATSERDAARKADLTVEEDFGSLPNELGIELCRARSATEEPSGATGCQEAWAGFKARCGAKTAPRPVGRVAADSGSHGVVDDVANRFEQMLVRLDCRRREPRLEEVPAVAVTLVEAPRVRTVQSMHSVREVGSGQRCEHVKVTRHKAIGDARPSESVNGLRQKAHEQTPVGVVEKDRGSPDAARRDVQGDADRLNAVCSTQLLETLDGFVRGVEMAAVAAARADVASCLARFTHQIRDGGHDRPCLAASPGCHRVSRDGAAS